MITGIDGLTLIALCFSFAAILFIIGEEIAA